MSKDSETSNANENAFLQRRTTSNVHTIRGREERSKSGRGGGIGKAVQGKKLRRKDLWSDHSKNGHIAPSSPPSPPGVW